MQTPDKTQPHWQQLELLVASIQKQLAPGVTVTHNAKLHGNLSETERQIDVLVECSVAPYSIRIVVDCKDYAVPVDVKGIEEFHGLMLDVGANKGALVCPAGFTKSAKKRAKKLEIDLYSPVDTDPHKWQLSPSMPTICDFRATRIAFSITCSEPVPLEFPADFFKLPVHDDQGACMGTILEVASREWNDGRYPIEPGIYVNVPLTRNLITTVDNGHGIQVPVTLTVTLDVTRRRYFGHVPITELHGFKDEQTGKVITNAFKFKLLDPVTIQNQWKKLVHDEEPPSRPVLEVIGLHCWGAK